MGSVAVLMTTIRELTTECLGEIYSGAGDLEVQALFDKLADRGLIILRADDLEDRIADDYADDVHRDDEDQDLAP